LIYFREIITILITTGGNNKLKRIGSEPADMLVIAVAVYQDDVSSLPKEWLIQT